MNATAYTLRDWMPSVPRARDVLPWHVVVVYNDMHAALRAAQLVERFGRKYGRRLAQQIHPVPVSYLGDPGCFERLLDDAHRADVIIVSFSGSGELPMVLKQWLEQCLRQKQPGDTTVVAMLGSADQADSPDSARTHFVRQAARKAGLDFFTAAMAPENEEIDDEPAFSEMALAG